jgi:hypothetical protein
VQELAWLSAENNPMSQLASITVLKASDVPHLGFWSKPKPRWFRKPESKFSEFLEKHRLRESIFDYSDGIYVAFVLAWIELQDEKFERYANPVIKSLMKYAGGSHWILQFKDQHLSALIEKPLPESEWETLLNKIGASKEIDFEWDSFEAARGFVYEKLLDLKEGEALLISVG